MKPAHVLHPERLPWFADGRLEADEAAEIELHLATCKTCRAEVEALRVLYRTLCETMPSDHPAAALLVDYHAHEPRISASERRLIAVHLRNCPACASDLSALQRSDAVAPASWRRPLLAAAACLLVIFTAGWNGDGSMARVVFPAPQRGTDSAVRLPAGGPWEFEVWPPLRVEARSYVARIQTSDDPATTVFVAIVTPSPQDGSVRFVVPCVLAPGRHRLVLSPRGGDASASYDHGFVVDTLP